MPALAHPSSFKTIAHPPRSGTGDPRNTHTQHSTAFVDRRVDAMRSQGHSGAAGMMAAQQRPAPSKKKKRNMKHGAPADTVVRGFHTPPTAPVVEDSDYSSVGSPLAGPVSPSPKGSPSVQPSSLSLALNQLKLNSPKSTRLADVDGEWPPSPLIEASLSEDTYEPPVARDFASEHSRELLGTEGGFGCDSPHRKMTASDFEPLMCLGRGAFGTVLLVKQRSTGRLFAQKQLKKASLTAEKRLVEQTKTERAILESVNRHPFVVKLYYAFQDRQKLYLILEYAQGGELFHHLAMERTFSEETAAFYMAEMVLALDYLHRNLGVVYRDLKPENCLLDATGHLLLTDFGLSKVALEDPLGSECSTRCNSFLGTIDYMAPEVIQGKEYGSAVDWWSLGALGYDLLTGAPPFSSNNHTKTQQKIVQAKLNLPYYLSSYAKDFLTRLLRKDPAKRLGGTMPKDLATIKAHGFFRKLNWRDLETRSVAAPIQPIITDPAAAENFDAEFTELAMSPVLSRSAIDIEGGGRRRERVNSTCSADDQFGGFSYVASGSLIDDFIL